jgi:phospho-N-acetylmuramoyl-pentapeptide-transferase
MIYHLLYPLHTTISIFNIFRYITFRTIYAGITAFLICFVFGPWVIRQIGRMQVKQFIRDDGPKSHLIKSGTPTMGGVLILFAVVVSTLIWANLSNVYIWIILFVTTGFGTIGFIDDYLMQVKKRSKGLGVKSKFIMQVVIAASASWFVYYHSGFLSYITVPFFKNISPHLGVSYIFFASLVIVGASNAVNLTDGLDGLATGPAIIASATYMLFAYVVGNVKIAQYLQINYVPATGELAVFCGALAGAGLGFLWFNTYPAQVFMGDTGSLPIGAAIGTAAVIIKQEILLVIVGGLFVMEALSVILQVGFFKITHGRRIFKMAPLHHHFELKGWPEPKVTVRFWIIAIILALVSLSTLKIR